MANASDTVFIAITTGETTVNGQKFSFNKGTTIVRSGHPLLKSCPSYFALYGEFLDWQPKR